MKTKNKIILFNWAIVLVSILTFVQGIFSFLKTYATSDNDKVNFTVSAYNETKFYKDGLLNLLDGSVSFVAHNPISITTPKEVVDLYNKYINEQFESGNVYASGYTTVSGSGRLASIEKTCYYVVEEQMKVQDGVFTNYNYCAEIPNGSGEFGRYSKNNVRKETFKDGVYTIELIEGYDEVVTYSKDENGKFRPVVVNDNFNKTQVYEKSEKNYFGYVLNENCVASCEIDSSSRFTTKATIVLNNSGYQTYRTDISQFSNSSNEVDFIKYQIEIVFDNFTGDIIQINKLENYKVFSTISVEMKRTGYIVFKKEN